MATAYHRLGIRLPLAQWKRMGSATCPGCEQPHGDEDFVIDFDYQNHWQSDDVVVEVHAKCSNCEAEYWWRTTIPEDTIACHSGLVGIREDLIIARNAVWWRFTCHSGLCKNTTRVQLVPSELNWA